MGSRWMSELPSGLLLCEDGGRGSIITALTDAVCQEILCYLANANFSESQINLWVSLGNWNFTVTQWLKCALSIGETIGSDPSTKPKREHPWPPGIFI